MPDSWPFWVGLGGFVGDFMLNRLQHPIGSDIYPTVTGSVALGVRDPGARAELARGSGRPAGRWLLLPFRLGHRQAAPAARSEPRWAQAMEERYGPPTGATAPRRPLAAGFSFVGQFVGGLAARLRPLGRPARVGRGPT